MPIFEVQTPDGRSFEIEAADQAAAQKVLEIGLGAAKREVQPTTPIRDVAQSAGAGVVKGLAEIPMLPVTISRLVGGLMDLPRRGVNAAFGADIPEPEQGPISGALYAGQDAVRNWLDEHLHKPETTAGQFAQTIGEFAVPATVIGKPAKAFDRAMRYGVVPGVASETAGQATKDTPLEPYARTGAALVAGGVGTVLDRPSTAAQALKARLPRGATEADVTAAEKLIADAAQSPDNIPLTWGQALSQVTNGKVDITDVERVVEQSRGGGATMREAQNERPARIAAAMGREMDAMTPTPQTPGVMGTRVKWYAEDALTNIRQRINAATQHLLNRASGQVINPQTFARLKNDEMFAEALNAVRNDPVHKRAIAGYPDDSVQVMNEIRMYFDRMAERASGAVQPDNFAARVYGDEARSASQAARQASPDYGDWLDQQAALRQGIQAPAEAGRLGKISRTDDPASQLNAIFERAPLAGSESDVTLAVRSIAERDPNTARSLVRNHLETGFNEATRKLATGQNEWGAAQFAAEIGGNPQQQKNLRAAVFAAFPKDGGVRWAGMQRLFRIMEATGKRRPANSATAQNLRIENEARRGGIIGNIASAVASPRVIRQAYEEWKLGGNMGAMAQIVTDPRSGPLFRSLLAAKSESAAIAAAGRLLMIGAEQSQGRLGVKPEDAFIPRGAPLAEPAGAQP